MNYSEKPFIPKCTYCNGVAGCEKGVNLDTCPKTIIYAEALQMQDFLELRPEDNPVALVDRLTDVNVFMARSGMLLAQAKKLQDDATAMVFALDANRVDKMTTTMANKFISAQTSDVNSLVNMLDRQNRAFVHQGDNLRTQISFAKQEVELQRRGY